MAIPETKLSLLNLFPIVKVEELMIADFWNAYQITNEFKSQSELFETYKTSDQERWDLIAQQFCEERELWWLIALFNDIEDPFAIYFDLDVPQSIKQLRILRPENVPLVLNEIRDRLLALEVKRLNDEEDDRSKST